MTHQTLPFDTLARPELHEAERSQSELFALDVLARADPLRSDSTERRIFYGDLQVVDTGLEYSKDLSGHEVWLKDERRQPSNSYKSGGASWAAMRTDPSDTLVTFSTGNHGFSLSIAGELRGQHVVVEATSAMSTTKSELLGSTDAEVHAVHESFSSAETAARDQALQPGHVLIEPFGNPDVVAGQCRMGFELVRDIVERGLARQTVIIPVPVAGGGLLSGIAIPIWEAKQQGILGPNIRIVAVQPEGTDTMRRGIAQLQAGKQLSNLYEGGKPDPDCDALVITEENLNADTMAIAADTRFVSGFYTVSKPDLGRAMVELEERVEGTVEPAASLPYAFAKAYSEQFPAYTAEDNEPVTFVLTISGGNKSPETSEKYRLAVAHDDNRLRSERHLLRPPEWFEEGGTARQVGAVAMRRGTTIIGGRGWPRG